MSLHTYITIGLGIAFAGLLTLFTLTNNKLKSVQADNTLLQQNIEYYEQEVNSTTNNNRVLQLKLSQLQASQDSLVVKLRDNMAKNNIALKELKMAQITINKLQSDTLSNQIVLNDTIRHNLDTLIRFAHNQQTFSDVRVKLVGDTLDVQNSLDITDSLSVFIKDSVYRAPAKNIFQKIFPCFRKKMHTPVVIIDSSNELVSTRQKRVVIVVDE
jgi:hypothetical protein